MKEWDDSATGEEAIPKCTEFHNIVCVLPQFDLRAIVVSFKSSQSKIAKRFLSACAQVSADFWSQKFALWATDETSADGKFEYKNFEFEKLGWVNEQEYKAGEALYNSLFDKAWETDTSDLEGTEENSEPGDDADVTPSARDLAATEAPASQQTVDAAPAEPAKKDPKKAAF